MLDPKLLRGATDAIRRRKDPSILEGYAFPKYERISIPTGILCIDQGLSLKGLEKGTICELFGDPATGKTQIALSAVRSAQELEYDAGWIDADFKLDRSQLLEAGVDPSRLLVSRAESAEEAIETTIDMLGQFPLVVLDSAASLISKEALAGREIPAHIEYLRLFGRLCREAERALFDGRSVLLLVNQVRSHLQSRLGKSFLNASAGRFVLRPKVTTRLCVSRLVSDASGVEVTKGLAEPGFYSWTSQIRWREGKMDLVHDLVYTALTTQFYGSDTYGRYVIPHGDQKVRLHGLESVRSYLEEHPELFSEHRKKVSQLL